MTADLPPGVLAMAGRGAAWQRWVDGLAAATRRHLDGWDLRPDGPPTAGARSLVLPVRTADGASAVLKLGFPDEAAEHEHLVLRKWGGDGAVRLLRADPPQRVVLLERLRPETLDTAWDVEACEVVAGLYGRLHVPAMPQLRTLPSVVGRWAEEFAQLPRSAPIPRRLVEQAMALSTTLTADRGVATVLHGDLHYRTVHAADRAPWLAIAPRPLTGDLHFELAPMLWHRADELTGNVRGGVRARFHTLVDVAGLDEDRARAWVVVRVVHKAVRELGGGAGGSSERLTQFVALAKAVQD